jgi:hypothetical protein
MLVGACSGMPPSYMTRIQPADAAPLADAIDGYVTPTLRQHGAAIMLEAPSGDTELAPRLRNVLGEQGYRLVDTNERGSHRVGYAVSSFDAGALLVQVFVDDRRAARLYARGPDGMLRPRGPYTSVEAGS